LQRRFVGKAGQHHVVESCRLRGDRFGDARIRVAEQVAPPGADAVQVSVAVGVDQPRAVAAHDRDQRQLRSVLAHLGARMPHVRKVARGKVGIAGRGSGHSAMIAAKTNGLKRG
jgi:hypothetical protein